MNTTWISSFFKTAAVGALFIISLAIFGCGEDKGPMEKAGKKADKTMEEAGDKTDEALGKAGDSMEEMGDKMDKTMDETMEKPAGQ